MPHVVFAAEEVEQQSVSDDDFEIVEGYFDFICKEDNDVCI